MDEVDVATNRPDTEPEPEVEAAETPAADTPAAAETPAAEAVETPAAAQVTAEQLEGLLAMKDDLAVLMQALREPQAEPGYQEPAGDPFVLDPMADPGEFTQGLVHLMQQVVAEQMQPMMPLVARHGQTEIETIVGGFTDIDGYDPTDATFRTLTEQVATELLPTIKQEMRIRPDQQSPEAARTALRRGAEVVAGFARAQRDAGEKAYIERNTADLEALQGAEREPSAEGAGGIRRPSTEGMDEVAFANRYVA